MLTYKLTKTCELILSSGRSNKYYKQHEGKIVDITDEWFEINNICENDKFLIIHLSIQKGVIVDIMHINYDGIELYILRENKQ